MDGFVANALPGIQVTIQSNFDGRCLLRTPGDLRRGRKWTRGSGKGHHSALGPAVFSHPSTIHPPTSRASSVSTVIAEDVHSGQVEVPRSLQHVPIVGIELFKAMLFGAGQV